MITTFEAVRDAYWKLGYKPTSTWLFPPKPEDQKVCGLGALNLVQSRPFPLGSITPGMAGLLDCSVQDLVDFMRGFDSALGYRNDLIPNPIPVSFQEGCDIGDRLVALDKIDGFEPIGRIL